MTWLQRSFKKNWSNIQNQSGCVRLTCHSTNLSPEIALPPILRLIFWSLGFPATPLLHNHPHKFIFRFLKTLSPKHSLPCVSPRLRRPKVQPLLPSERCQQRRLLPSRHLSTSNPSESLPLPPSLPLHQDPNTMTPSKYSLVKAFLFFASKNHLPQVFLFTNQRCTFPLAILHANYWWTMRTIITLMPSQPAPQLAFWHPSCQVVVSRQHHWPQSLDTIFQKIMSCPVKSYFHCLPKTTGRSIQST